MKSIKKSAKEAVSSGRETALRVGKVAKSAAVAGAKAGAAAAITAGTLEARKNWKETSPAAKKRTRNGVAALLVGVAVLGAAGVAMAKSRRAK
jgi:hypothetical protein